MSLARLCLALVAAGLLAAPAAVAQPAAAPLAIGASPNEAVLAVRKLIAAVNGDAAARRAFASETYATSALGREPADVRAAFLNRLAADSGGLDLIDAKPEGPRMTEAVVVTRKGRRFARVVAFTSSKEPGKIVDLFVFPTRDPAVAAKEAWPTRPLASAEVAREIERRLDSLAREDVFSGAVLVADGDRVLFRRAYGMADQVWKAPNRPDTAFNAASVTKMLTAAAILKLQEQGRLSLDDTLAEWAPDYPHRAAAETIKLRHLLSHTAGVGAWDGRLVRARSTPEILRTMTNPPEGEPGVRMSYSNAGYVLLAAAVEKATGEPFETALKRLVLDPAGMKRTAAWPVAAVIPNRATGYLRLEDDPLGVGPRYANDQYLGYKGDGSGGLYTTVDDLFAFHRAVATGRLLRPETTRLFLEPVTDFPGTPRPSRYGLGMRFSDCAGQPTFGHSGGGANSGISNATFTTLDRRWTVIVLSNYDPVGEQVAQDICDAVARS